MPPVPSRPPEPAPLLYLLPGYPSEYLLLRQEPRASSAARLQKFWGKKGVREGAAELPPEQGPPRTITIPCPKHPILHLRGDELQPPALPILLLPNQGPHLRVALGQTLLPRPARHVPSGSRHSSAMLCLLAAGGHPATTSLQGLHRRGGADRLRPHTGGCQAPLPPKHPWISR